MKIRSDFVSNSSSSSFICAINGTYPIKTLAKDIAQSCVNKEAEYHDRKLAYRNQTILEFCLNTYELLYLGELFLETKTEKYTKDSIRNRFKSYGYKRERTEEQFEQEVDNHWNWLIDSWKDAQKPNAEDWLVRNHGRDSFDEKNQVFTHVYDIEAGGIIICEEDMDYHFTHYGYKTDDEPETVKNRVAALVKKAKSVAKHEDDDQKVWIYQITKRTLKNTRNLLDAGKKLRFDRWENIEELEKRLEEGQKVFALRIAHSGDGYGNFYIYEEDDANSLDDLAVEILASECM